MKKIFKLFLAVAISFTVLSLTSQEDITISAKISGDYSYEVGTDNTVTILNYNGNEKDLTIPNEIDGMIVKRIGYGAFAECKSIEVLNIPESITIIGNYAFSQCSQIKVVNMSDAVVSIGQYAFAGCNSLESIVVPKGISTLNYGTFFDCINLKDVTLPDGIKTIGGMVFANCKSLENITLPTTLNSIGNSGFADCTALKSIEIPNGVNTLASGAFSGCLSLQNINLPETLVSIGQNAFQDCIALKSVYLPESVTGIGYGAFTGCADLVDINIPSKVTEIKNATFSGCSSLESIVIPNNIVSLGDNVFSGCMSLKTLDIPDSVTSIGVAAFSNCSKLVSVKLPKNLRTISVNMFRYCDSIETIVIPNGVQTIEITAFSNCANLKSVIFPETVKTINGKIFVAAPMVTSYVIDGSFAHTYMIRNTYDFELIKTGINLDKKELNLNVGDTSTYVAVMSPFSIVDNAQLTWSSSDSSCVSVNDKGEIEALAKGTAVITAKTSNGLSATSTVTVTDDQIEIDSITLNKSTLTLATESKEALRATINPTNTTEDKTLVWESNDISIATVSATGIVTARSPGTTTISVKTSNDKYSECIVTVNSDIKFVSLNLTAMEMEEGVTQSLRATINPSNTTNSKALEWKSSNTNVATVSDNGEVTAISQGYATISVITVNGKKAECKITVSRKEEEIPITSVNLNKSELTLKEEQTETLIATINPSNTTDSKVLNWSSSNESVAKVDTQGKITAIDIGTTIIKVTTSNGKEDFCVVTVIQKDIPISSVSLNKKELNLKVGKDETLIATIHPSDTTDSKDLLWESSNTSVATVDSNGKVTAVASGTAIITVVTEVNGLTDSCEVVVIEINKTELTNKINSAEKLNEDSYTIDSYTKLSSILNNAKNALVDEDISQNDVDELVVELQNAMDTLVLRADTTLLTTVQSTIDACKLLEDEYAQEDFANLKQAIVDAEALMNKGFGNISKTEAENAIKLLNDLSQELSLNAAKEILQINISIASDILNGDLSGYDGILINQLRLALSNGQELIDTNSKDLAQINNAIKNLEVAINALQEEVDVTYLEQLVDYVSTISPGKYTTETWNNVANYLAEAQDVINRNNISQSVVDQIYNNLFSAVSNLEVKVDKSALNMNIDMAQSIVDNISSYKSNTVRGLESLLNDAKLVNESEEADQNEVNTMSKKLMQAIMKARLKG